MTASQGTVKDGAVCPALAVVLVIALVAIAPPVRAQHSDRPAPADTTRRDTTGRDTTRAATLAPIIITGTRLTEVDERTPVQVDRIGLQNIMPGPTAPVDALLHLPGITALDDQGTRLQPTLDLRGFTLSPIIGVPQGVSVFLDGVRINEPDAQEVNFDLIPMEAVQRADLVRGPATLFGKNALAGALVLATQRGGDTVHVSGELTVGPYGQRGGVLTGSGSYHGVDGFVMAHATQEDGYRDDTPARTRMVFANLGRRTDSTDFAFTALYAHDRLMQAGTLPESWYGVAPRRNFTPGDYFVPELWHFAARWHQPFAGGQLRGNLFDRSDNTEQLNVNIDAPTTDAFVDNRSTGATIEWSRPTSAGGLPLAITVGGEYARNEVKYRVLEQPAAGAPEIDSTCNPSTAVCTDARVHEDDGALYAQAALTASSWLSITASARGDVVRVPFRDLVTPLNDATNTYWRFSPRLGANYVLSDAFRGYAAISTGFRAPAPLELACADPAAPCSLPSALGDDPRLAPVTVTDYETGIDWDLGAGVSLDLVGYHEDVKNEIVFVASRTTAGYFQNISRSRRQGIEASTTVQLPAGLHASASYAFTDATYQSPVLLSSQLPVADSVVSGDVFPMTPRHTGSIEIGATRTAGASVLRADLSMKLVSSQFLRGNDVDLEMITLPSGDRVSGRIPAYSSTMLDLRWEHPWWMLGVHLDNLFDQRYATFGSIAANALGPIGGPAPDDPDTNLERFLTPNYPRSVTVSLRVSY